VRRSGAPAGTRRPIATAARVAVVLAAVVALAAVALLIGRADEGATTPGGSTLDRTLADPDGNGELEPGPGEPLLDRTELAPATSPGRELARFAQISDAHVRDEESPGRPAVLDRLGPPFTSTFRPHEALTTQVLAAAVDAVNRFRPQSVVVTGDLVDNPQQNELDQALAVLSGRRVAPDSGAPGYEGFQSASNPDPFFYRPDVDAPRRPGLLASGARPFAAPGLASPWYPVAGNHDLLVQGEVAPTPRIQDLATGSEALAELDPELDVPEDERALSPEVIERVLGRGLPGRTLRVAPDPERRQLDAQAVLDRLREASGRGGRGPLLDYTFDIGPSVRAIVLDTVRRDAGSGGLVRSPQLDWLARQLGAAGERHVVVFTHQPLRTSAGGQQVLTMLDREPRVLAAVAGHTHNNRIDPRRSDAGGYWLIETASLADFPQQARAFRLVETAPDRVAIETWMLDHTGSPLAGTARELAFLDAQGGRPQGSAGERDDRNVRLHR